jgi:3-methyladenine DNA glycosylase AlkD
MNAQELFDDIDAYCRQHADKTIVEKYSRFFKEGYDAWGLTEQQLTDKVAELINLPQMNLTLILRTAPLLLETGKYEETSFAILLAHAYRDRFDRKAFNAMDKWFDVGIINWAHCDVLCALLMKEFFARGIITLDDLSEWRTAANKHQRRAVPVAMLNLLKAATDYRPLFKFIDPLMLDSEEKVQQGLGWFLREAWKLKPEPTEAFLLKWKDRAGRKIFQYATEKMTPENKRRFKKQKS